MELLSRREVEDRKKGNLGGPMLTENPKQETQRSLRMGTRFYSPNAPKVDKEKKQNVSYYDKKGNPKTITMVGGFYELPKDLQDPKDKDKQAERSLLVGELLDCAGLREAPKAGEAFNDLTKEEYYQKLQDESKQVVHVLGHVDAIQQNKKMNIDYQITFKGENGINRTENIPMKDSVIYTANKNIRDALINQYRLSEVKLITRHSDPETWKKFFLSKEEKKEESKEEPKKTGFFSKNKNKGIDNG